MENSITTSIYIMKTTFISICTYLTFLKIINDKNYFSINKIIGYFCIFVMSVIIILLKNKMNLFINTAFWIFMLSYIFSITTNNSVGYTIMETVISLAFNYIIFFISIIITFIISKIIKSEGDLLNFILIAIIHTSVLAKVLKIKRFKYGILFLQKNSKNEYLDILILNICVSILFFIIMFSNRKQLLTRTLFLGIIMLSGIMFITIQKSLQLYYKQKLLIKELDETKVELEKKKQEIEELEKENLNFSKTSHSLAHKQRALEYKINQLMLKSETAEELEIKDRINNLSKELYNEPEIVELAKTGIPEIDDVLQYMQAECTKNKIDFNLQITGNIHYMTNNIINKEELEILLADHIKDAIIAINHSENINRSILVKLGKIDKTYSLYIYDSGIEFEKETLSQLGKKPITTHAEEGGTGMGFMNTFDTLRKYEASLIIDEYNKPSKDNYTKAIIIKFDKKNEFKIISYREKEREEELIKINN